MSLRARCGEGEVILADDDNPGQRECHLCRTVQEVWFCRFCAPRAIGNERIRVVYIRLCRACLHAVGHLALKVP